MDTVLVTGAAGGIGRALSREIRKAGYRVVGLDVTVAPPDPACDHYIACDLGTIVEDPGYAVDVFTQVREVLGESSLKAVVNNAAVQVVSPIAGLTRDDWRTTLDVNVVAPFILVQEFMPELEQSGGMVLNISSIHAKLTKPEFIAYATSKAALSGLTRAMAVEFGNKVRVNAIEPAAIDTEMLRAGFEGKPEEFTRLAGFHPTGRIGNPEEVAALALVLIGGTIPFLNGASIALDGGIGGRLHDTA